jgi:crossover junction endodeoxyribonuclease RuvC
LVDANARSKVILGVDPGSVVTGYGIITLGMAPVDYGCIRPPRGERLSTRRRIIFEAIEHLIESHCPVAMAVESQYVRDNPRTAITLGMVTGIVILAASRHGIPIYEYPPSRPKKAVGAGGQASKEQVAEMVRRLLNLRERPSPPDAADALAIAICHLTASQNSLTLGEEI